MTQNLSGSHNKDRLPRSPTCACGSAAALLRVDLSVRGAALSASLLLSEQGGEESKVTFGPAPRASPGTDTRSSPRASHMDILEFSRLGMCNCPREGTGHFDE